MKSYKIKFSLQGIMAVILVMVPNILYAFFTPVNDVLSNNEAGFWFWNLLENIGRFGTMISLCIICNKTVHKTKNILDIVGLVSLFFYYVLWILYFFGSSSGILLTGMAVFPTVFF